MRGETARSPVSLLSGSDREGLGGGSAPVHPLAAPKPRSGEGGRDTANPTAIPRRAQHGSERRQRTTLLAVRLTQDERAAIDAHAQGAGLTSGSYARLVLLGVRTRQVRRPPIEKRELVRLLGELGHIGGNLNQIAYARNCGAPVSQFEIRNALNELKEMRDAVLAALGRSSS